MVLFIEAGHAEEEVCGERSGLLSVKVYQTLTGLMRLV